MSRAFVGVRIKPMEEVYRHFGRVLRKRLREGDISQEVLAERAGLSRATVANIENGRQRVSLHLFLDLAEALGVDACELLPQRASTPLSAEVDRA